MGALRVSTEPFFMSMAATASTLAPLVPVRVRVSPFLSEMAAGPIVLAASAASLLLAALALLAAAESPLGSTAWPPAIDAPLPSCTCVELRTCAAPCTVVPDPSEQHAARADVALDRARTDLNASVLRIGGQNAVPAARGGDVAHVARRRLRRGFR